MTPSDSRTSPHWQIERFNSPVDGLSIRYATWSPSKARWGILFLNGRSEWLEKYADLPPDFGFGDDVMWASLDHRGQGASDGSRADVESYDSFAKDAAEVAKLAFGSLPFAIVAHSMGSLIGTYAVSKSLLKPQAMVLCSPLFALPNEPLHRIIARPLAQIVAKSAWRSKATGTRSIRDDVFYNNPLTHSFLGFQKILKSPYPYASPTFSWVAATFAATDFIFSPSALTQLRCPVRIITGSKETVVDPSVYPDWCQKARLAQAMTVELLRITEGRHELLNEIPRIRREVITLARDWLQKFMINSSGSLPSDINTP